MCLVISKQVHAIFWIFFFFLNFGGTFDTIERDYPESRPVMKVHNHWQQVFHDVATVPIERMQKTLSNTFYDNFLIHNKLVIRHQECRHILTTF